MGIFALGNAQEIVILLLNTNFKYFYLLFMVLKQFFKYYI